MLMRLVALLITIIGPPNYSLVSGEHIHRWTPQYLPVARPTSLLLADLCSPI